MKIQINLSDLPEGTIIRFQDNSEWIWLKDDKILWANKIWGKKQFNVTEKSVENDFLKSDLYNWLNSDSNDNPYNEPGFLTNIPDNIKKYMGSVKILSMRNMLGTIFEVNPYNQSTRYFPYLVNNPYVKIREIPYWTSSPDENYTSNNHVWLSGYGYSDNKYNSDDSINCSDKAGVVPALYFYDGNERKIEINTKDIVSYNNIKNINDVKKIYDNTIDMIDTEMETKDSEINKLQNLIKNKDEKIQTIQNILNDNKKIIDCGDKHSMLIKDDYIYTCGDNSCGQLGLGDTTNRKVFTKTNKSQIKSFSTGYNHSAIVTNDGMLFICGDNSCGQLGLGDNINRNTFTEVNNISNVKEVKCGDRYTIVVLDNNDILSCGLNDKGQLCLNDMINKNIFTKINMN